MDLPEPAFDVVLTYGASEVMWAGEVERRLAEVGLNVFRIVSADAGRPLDDTWEAHAESHALVALLAPGAEPPLLMFEAGAAMMGQKPVYVLYKGPKPAKLPRYLEQFGVFRVNEVNRVVDLVLEAAKPLSEREQQILLKSAGSLDSRIEQLQSDSEKADQFASRFNRTAKSSVTSHRLLRELLRLRRKRQVRSSERVRV